MDWIEEMVNGVKDDQFQILSFFLLGEGEFNFLRKFMGENFEELID